MAGPSRNIVVGSWTQEEFERLFGEELLDIDVLEGYVVDQPTPAATDVGSSRYAHEDFTESQPVEGEEYVPNTQLPKTALREVPPRRSSIWPVVGPGYPVIGKVQVQQVQHRPLVIQRQRDVTKGHQVLFRRGRN